MEKHHFQSLPTGMGSKVQTKNKFQPKNFTSQTQRKCHRKQTIFFLFKTKKKSEMKYV